MSGSIGGFEAVAGLGCTESFLSAKGFYRIEMLLTVVFDEGESVIKEQAKVELKRPAIVTEAIKKRVLTLVTNTETIQKLSDGFFALGLPAGGAALAREEVFIRSLIKRPMFRASDLDLLRRTNIFHPVVAVGISVNLLGPANKLFSIRSGTTQSLFSTASGTALTREVLCRGLRERTVFWADDFDLFMVAIINNLAVIVKISVNLPGTIDKLLLINPLFITDFFVSTNRTTLAGNVVRRSLREVAVFRANYLNLFMVAPVHRLTVIILTIMNLSGTVDKLPGIKCGPSHPKPSRKIKALPTSLPKSCYTVEQCQERLSMNDSGDYDFRQFIQLCSESILAQLFCEGKLWPST